VMERIARRERNKKRHSTKCCGVFLLCEAARPN
jgi:hypothetical protein